MREVRYRTEAFSGLWERDAAEVMAFETFELGNTDILECLRDTVLCGHPLCEKFDELIDDLEENGGGGDLFTDDKVDFYREVLSEIEKATGVPVKYALWLADKDVVTNRERYGKDMADEEDFDCYEIGPVVLSDLGRDGTLYGYPDMPVCLEDRIERLEDRLTDIINERENGRLSAKRANQLDDLYLEVDAEIQEIREVLSRKVERTATSVEEHPSLEDQIQSAEQLASSAATEQGRCQEPQR